MRSCRFLPLCRLAILLFLWPGVCSVCAQEAPCHQSVLVNVLDRNGLAVPGLTVADFRATFRKQPVKVLSADLDHGPRRIVILLDASGSMMEPNPRWIVARHAATKFLSNLVAADQVAMIVFREHVERKTEFADGPAAVSEVVAALKEGSKALPKGRKRTALFDSILVALRMLTPPNEGDVIYAITDGGENSSRATQREVENALLSSRVRFYVFSPDVPDPSLPTLTEEELMGPSALRDLIALNGGLWLSALQAWHGVGARNYQLNDQDLVKLDPLFRALQMQIDSVYRLELELHDSPGKAEKWVLELPKPPKGKKSDRDLVYPSKLHACGSSTVKGSTQN